MSTSFDRIEDHLRDFIEKSIQLLPDSNRLHAQIIQLTRSLQSHLQLQIETTGTIPSAITISFHPTSLLTWRDHPEILEYLRTAIHDLASDQGILTTVAPDIYLEADPLLPLDSFAIRQGAPSSGTGETKAMLPSNNLSHDSSRDRPTFHLIDEQSRLFPLWEPSINIGRSAHNNLVINDPRVSRLHAQIRLVDGVYTVFDLNSRGGTFVNGKQVEQAALKSGDIISLAGYSLRCLDDSPQSSVSPSQTLPNAHP